MPGWYLDETKAPDNISGNRRNWRPEYYFGKWTKLLSGVN